VLKTTAETAQAETWRNWSGSVSAHPAEVARPTSEAELTEVVRRARTLRVVGAGHSFTPLCETDGTLLSLERLPGAVTVSADRRTATVPAGWTVERVTAALWAEGLSLGNQGDIDQQTIGGAIGTGTHGTGAGLGSLSTMARGFRIALADGSVVRCDAHERPELFQAQRLGMGLLGVAIEIELEVLPAYHLQERIEKRSLDEVLEGFDDWAGANRHIEFFVFPYADVVMLKTLVVAQDDGAFKEPGPEDETVFRLCCELGAAAPAFIPTLQKLLTRGSSGRVHKRTGPAHRIFPSTRTIRFEEMEYELPRAAGLQTLKTTIDWIRAKSLPVAFPFEFRMSAGDDIWLSPMNRGPVASVSMHQYAGMPWRELFTEAETIFQDAGGRPHWGKRHTLDRTDIDACTRRRSGSGRRGGRRPRGQVSLNTPPRALFE
jgi:FAD-linked oxidoreductase